jgi:aminopeptidase N
VVTDFVPVQQVPLAERRERGAIVDVVSYDLVVDLTGGAETFTSRVEVEFGRTRPGARVSADLQAAAVRRAVLNGADLDVAGAGRPGRLELPRLAARNTLVVEAEFTYNPAGAGLRRVAGPGGQACVYSKAYPGGAPRMYCCFDQQDLRAPFKVTVHAPAGWACLGNGPVTSRPPAGRAGMWRFAATPPIAPYLASFVAGPFTGRSFTCARGDGPPLPVSVSALPAAASLLAEAARPELFAGPVRFYERGLGAAYPYGKCDVVFVPGYAGLAFGAPGLITIKDQVLTTPGTGTPGLYLAAVIAHELAHAWFGGLVDNCRPGDGWLFEALPTWLSRAALEETWPEASPWEPSVSAFLPDHAYAASAGAIRQLEDLIGRHAVLSGLRELMGRHAYGCITREELIRYWSRASRRDLRGWATETLKPASGGLHEDSP